MHEGKCAGGSHSTQQRVEAARSLTEEIAIGGRPFYFGRVAVFSQTGWSLSKVAQGKNKSEMPAVALLTCAVFNVVVLKVGSC